MKIKTYEQAFDLINVEYTDRARQTVTKLNDEGYNIIRALFVIAYGKHQIN
jgi:hypothetical protein